MSSDKQRAGSQRAQGKLDSRSMLDAVLDAMSEGVVLIDRKGVIVLVNRHVDLIGLTRDQLVNQNIETLLKQRELGLAVRLGFTSDKQVRDLLLQLQTGGEIASTAPVSYALDAEHSPVYIQRRIVPLPGDDGQLIGIILAFYDETNQHELDQARDDLTSMIVHDMRSPLASVNSGLKLLLDLVPEDHPTWVTIEATTSTSQRAVRKLLNRVNSLLDISQSERGQLKLETEPTELALLVDNVCLELGTLARELEVKLVSEVHGHSLLLNVDADKVERVLLNLVDNALKFCPGSGTVTIRARLLENRDSSPSLAQIEVVDTGPGVPDEYKSRLFERYVQVRGRRGARSGIGLGLTFCRLTVEAHGGGIWIEDNPEGGSIFAFTLPLARSEAHEDDDEG